jgi:hypothetical protein
VCGKIRFYRSLALLFLAMQGLLAEWRSGKNKMVAQEQSGVLFLSLWLGMMDMVFRLMPF